MAGVLSLSGTLTATSSLSGIIDKQSVYAGTISGTSTTAGTVLLDKQLVSTVSGTTTITGEIHADWILSGIIPSIGTPSGLLSSEWFLSGSIPALSTLSGFIRTWFGLSSATSTLTAKLSYSWSLSGTIAGTGTPEGYLCIDRKFVGSTATTSSCSGSLTIATYLSSTVSSTSSLTGDIDIGWSIAGTIPASSACDGTLGIEYYYFAEIFGYSALSADLETDVGLSGTCASTSLVGAIPTIEYHYDVAGIIPGVSDLDGHITSDWVLSGTCAATTSVTGKITTEWALSGAILSVGVLTGLIGAPEVVIEVTCAIKLEDLFPVSMQDYAYRVRQSITATSSWEGYPAGRIHVYRSSGTNANGNIYTGTACRTDYADVVITRSDGETVLQKHVEGSYTDQEATIWFEIPPGTNPDVYVYFGKPDATPLNNLFLWEHDMTDGTIDYDGKYQTPSDPSKYYISGGVLKLERSSLSNTLKLNKELEVDGRIFIAKVRHEWSSGEQFYIWDCLDGNHPYGGVYDGQYDYKRACANTCVNYISSSIDWHYVIMYRHSQKQTGVHDGWFRVEWRDASWNLLTSKEGVENGYCGVFNFYMHSDIVNTPAAEIDFWMLGDTPVVTSTITYPSMGTATPNEFNGCIQIGIVDTITTKAVIPHYYTAPAGYEAWSRVTLCNITGGNYTEQQQAFRYVVKRSDGANTADTIYVGANGCRTDYQDVRFLHWFAGGATWVELPCWLEKGGYNDERGIIWVGTNSYDINANTTYNFLCLTGNPSATRTWNQSPGVRTGEVFKEFDDFSRSELYYPPENPWWFHNGDHPELYSIVDGRLRCLSASSNEDYIGFDLSSYSGDRWIIKMRNPTDGSKFIADLNFAEPPTEPCTTGGTIDWGSTDRIKCCLYKAGGCNEVITARPFNGTEWFYVELLSFYSTRFFVYVRDENWNIIASNSGDPYNDPYMWWEFLQSGGGYGEVEFMAMNWIPYASDGTMPTQNWTVNYINSSGTNPEFIQTKTFAPEILTVTATAGITPYVHDVWDMSERYETRYPFTNMPVAPTVGETVTGQGSGATGTIAQYVTTSGEFAAVGSMVYHNTNGSAGMFHNGEYLNGATTGNQVAKVTGSNYIRGIIFTGTLVEGEYVTVQGRSYWGWVYKIQGNLAWLYPSSGSWYYGSILDGSISGVGCGTYIKEGSISKHTFINGTGNGGVAPTLGQLVHTHNSPEWQGWLGYFEVESGSFATGDAQGWYICIGQQNSHYADYDCRLADDTVIWHDTDWNYYTYYVEFTLGMSDTGDMPYNETLTGATSGHVGYAAIDKVTSGGWEGGTVTGYFLLQNVVGHFFENEIITTPTSQAETDGDDYTVSVGPKIISVNINRTLNQAFTTCSLTIDEDYTLDIETFFKTFQIVEKDHNYEDRILFVGFCPSTEHIIRKANNQTVINAVGFDWFLTKQYVPSDRISTLIWDDVGQTATYYDPALFVRNLIDESTSLINVRKTMTPSEWGQTGMPERAWVFTPQTSLLDTVNEIGSYTNSLLECKPNQDGGYVPNLYWVDIGDPGLDLDLDLPAKVTFTAPDKTIIDLRVSRRADVRYNRIRVYGQAPATGLVIEGIFEDDQAASREGGWIEYVEVNSQLTTQNEVSERAVKLYQLLIPNANVVDVTCQQRVDLQLYQKVEFVGYPRTPYGDCRIVSIQYNIRSGHFATVSFQAIHSSSFVGMAKLKVGAKKNIGDEMKKLVQSELKKRFLMHVGNVVAVQDAEIVAQLDLVDNYIKGRDPKYQA